MLEQEIDPYQKEIVKILAKIKKTLNEAKKQNIELKFDYDFEDSELNSFKDVISYKDKLFDLKEKCKKIEKDYKSLKQNKSISDISVFTSNIEVISDINVLVAILEDYDVDMIKSLADAVVNKYENCFVLFANVNNNHVNIISKSNSDKINCGAIVKELSVNCMGNGGGSKNFAQGGGSDATNILQHLEKIKEDVRSL